MTSSQLKEQQLDFENRIKSIGAEVRELKQRERTPVKAFPKEEQLYSQNDGAARIDDEELNSLRQELKELSDNHNVT
jgi:hypothetical protein